MIKRFYKLILSEKNRNGIRFLIQRTKTPFYLGNNFECNFCNISFRKLLPKGNIKRPNAICPNCGSLERTRLLNFYLEEETDIFKTSKKILHIAPEDCLKKKFKKIDNEYIDGDINAAYASNIVDITNIQYPDNYFDYIICSHVLGHIPDEKKAIQELYRVLKPNGQAIILTLLNQKSDKTTEDIHVTTAKERLISYGEHDLCRLHGVDIKEKLVEENFSVDIIDYRKKLSEDINKRFSTGNGEREIIFKCVK